jgi:ApaG protein
VQLVARRWEITDARGHVEEVRGPGVVGEQPTIQPGDSYSYASGCPLGTPTGSMVGGYYMTGPSGRSFEAAIPAFSLDVPGERRVLN